MGQIETTTRVLLQKLKNEVCGNTVLATHSDMQELAGLPVIVLYLPVADRIRYDDANVPVQDKDYEAGTVKICDPPLLYNLSYDYEIIAETTLEVLSVGEKLAVFLEKNLYLEVGGKSYPLAVTQPLSRTGTLEPANVRRATGSFLIEGVEIEFTDYIEGKLVQKAEIVVENIKTGGSETIELRWETK